MEMVELTLMEDVADVRELKQLITNHYEYTKSTLAKSILDNWDAELNRFIKVMPIEYKKVLQDEKLEAIKKKIAQVEFDY
jgi:glutamate synthase (NADPH/NADH) large chain